MSLTHLISGLLRKSNAGWAAAFIVLIGACLAVTSCTPSAPQQPIPFNHEAMVQKGIGVSLLPHRCNAIAGGRDAECGSVYGVSQHDLHGASGYPETDCLLGRRRAGALESGVPDSAFCLFQSSGPRECWLQL